MDYFRELWSYRELLANLVRRDLKVRYKNSVLGLAWSLLMPLFQAFIIWTVFKVVLGIRQPNYSVWVITALIPWTFTETSLLDSAQTVLYHYNLVKKAYFPRELLPLASVLSNLIHFLIAMTAVTAGMFLLVGIRPTPWLLLTPLVVLLQLSLNFGLSCFAACLNVYFEDTKYILQVLLRVGFYVCPILYPSSKISDATPSPAAGAAAGGLRSSSGRLAGGAAAHLPSVVQSALRHLHLSVFTLYRLNPLATLIIAYQKTILAGATSIDPRPLPPGLCLVLATTCLAVGGAGFAFYRRRQWEFPERL